MSNRSVTHPPNDPKMWRRLISRAHPDAGGDHELFIWTTAVKDAVCSGPGASRGNPEPRPHDPRRPASAGDAAERVPFHWLEDFNELSEKVQSVAADAPECYARLLRLLTDCRAVEDGLLYHQQSRGATYKQLAAIAHKAGMSKVERIQWYRLAESIPLSQRHAGHILGKMQRRQGAA